MIFTPWLSYRKILRSFLLELFLVQLFYFITHKVKERCAVCTRIKEAVRTDVEVQAQVDQSKSNAEVLAQM